MTRITSVNAEPLNLPLTEPFEIALGRQHQATNVLITVETSDGTVGYGEAAPFPPVTGETQSAAIETIQAAAAIVEDHPLAAYRAAVRELARTFPGNSASLAGLETALVDAYCRSRGLSLAEFAGGPPTPIRTDYTVPLVDPQTARDRANQATAAGYDQLKIKAGTDPDTDLDRIKAVDEAAPDATLKIDANQGWTVSQTRYAANRLDASGVRPELIEQPVAADNIRGLAQIRRHTSIPIAADESLFTPTDALRLVDNGAADILNIKLAKSGLRGALDIIAIAEAANLDIMVGCMLESSIGIHTTAHLVAGTGAVSYIDLDGNRLINEDVVPAKTGPIHDISGPGHGITPMSSPMENESGS